LDDPTFDDPTADEAMSARRRAAIAALLSLTALTVRARAQDAPPAAPAQSAPEDPTSAAPDTDPRLDDAKVLFRQGNELRKAGDWQGALQRYLLSRALVPSLPNTMNAAICLERLGRVDEALDLYEHVLTDFAAQIDDDVRRGLAATMSNLRRQVGSLDVSANVDGMVVVEGRQRGRLPLVAPLRVLPGTRRVVVLKEGYEPVEKQVTVAVGQTAFVQVALRPLRAAGRLHAEDKALEGGELSVDGAVVGKLPWEGSLRPGTHVVTAQKDDLGTAPRLVTVIEGQTITVPLHPQPLGPELRIGADPASADVFIDGVRVGRGTWQGRLPVGAAVVEARETGYLPARAAVRITRAPARPIALRLRIDEAHPRWRTAEGHFFAEVQGGLALAHALGTGAEASCVDDRCSEHGVALGFLAAGRAGYELANRLSFSLALGYLRVETHVARTYTASYRADLASTPERETQTVTYAFEDALRLSGPFLLGGIGYRVPVGRRFGLGFRLEAGALLATGSDSVEASVSDGEGNRAPVDVTIEAEDGNIATAATPLVVPQVAFQVRAGPFQLGAGLALVTGLAEGPVLKTGETQVRSDVPCTAAAPGALSCAPRERFIGGERAFGRFLLWVPNLGARLDL
jgi:hypothetical protein